MNEIIFSQNKHLREAQDYLTINKDGQEQLIVGIAYLSENHSHEEIIRFLRDYLREKERELRELILGNKSNCQIDKTVAVMFRIHMAIMTLEREVNHIVRFKHRTAKSRHVRKRDRRSHRRSRIGKDKNNDGEDWEIGHGTRRAA
jgi:hypothetical protein